MTGNLKEDALECLQIHRDNDTYHQVQAVKNILIRDFEIPAEKLIEGITCVIVDGITFTLHRGVGGEALRVTHIDGKYLKHQYFALSIVRDILELGELLEKIQNDLKYEKELQNKIAEKAKTKKWWQIWD